MMSSCTAVARVLTIVVFTALATPIAAQQAYPSKPIRLIPPFAPGGTATLVARLIGQKLTESWGQPVLVDNRPGGNSIIGTDAVAKAPPDGYTILSASVSFVTSALLQPTPYDAIKDFAPVATLAVADSVLVLHPSVPASNLREFIALAKSKPGQLNYPSSGTGTVNHLAVELFSMMTGIRMQHVPYKGTGPAITDLVGGQVQVALNDLPAVIQHIKTGRLKAIAATGQNRMSSLPQVPTIAEAGLSGYDVRIWYGVLAPGGTPKEIIDKLSREIAGILAMPEIKEKLASLGLDAFISTPDQFAALIKTEMAKFARIIKTANIKLEN